MGLYRKKSSQKLRKNCLNKITKKMLAFIILLLIIGIPIGLLLLSALLVWLGRLI